MPKLEKRGDWQARSACCHVVKVVVSLHQCAEKKSAGMRNRIGLRARNAQGNGNNPIDGPWQSLCLTLTIALAPFYCSALTRLPFPLKEAAGYILTARSWFEISFPAQNREWHIPASKEAI